MARGYTSRGLSMSQLRDILERADANEDGSINKKELKEVLRVLGVKFTRWNSWVVMRNIDLNQNGRIDRETEVKLLAQFLHKKWGIVVSDN